MTYSTRATPDRCGDRRDHETGRGNTPEDIRVAVPWFKPSRNETDITPQYYLRETAEWLVFPHELDALTPEELRECRPEIAAIVQGVKPRAKNSLTV